MSLVLQKENNAFDNIELYEEVEKTKLKNLLDCWDDLHLYKDEKKSKEAKDILTDYYKKIRNNRVKVKHLRKMKYGRSNAVKSLSLQNIKKVIRHYLCHNTYTDIDMVNAHPQILLQIMKKNMINTPHLENYVNNRDKIIQELIDEFNSSRDKIKKFLISIMYGCQYNGKNEFLINFKEELSRIANMVFNNNSELNDEIIKHKSMHQSDLNDYIKNQHHSLLSYFLQTWENKILSYAYEYITLNISNKYKNTLTICFDGIMVKTSEVSNINLIDMSDFVFDKTGFRINFDVKEMKDTLSEILDKNINKIDDLDESKLTHLDIPYMESLSNYVSKKYYFEHFVCKIIDPEPCFIFNNKLDNKNLIFDESKLRKLMRPVKSGCLTETGKEIKFIDKWFDDIEQNLKRKYDFIPFNKDFETIDDDIYNTFTGFNSNIHTDYDKSKRDKIIKPFLDLGKELCEGSDKCFDYFLKFIANMVREPRNRPAIAFVIKSTQGEGKNTLLYAIKNVIGKHNYISSSKPDDFFGTHAEGFVNKLLVNPDECEGKDTFDFQGKMKAFISEDTITVNPKCVRPTTINNYARTIITTNKPNPINIDFRSKDRRYVVFKGSGHYTNEKNKKRYDSGFWTRLYKHFDNPKFIAALYDYLMDIDYSNTNWIYDRPLTESYWQMARNSIPVEALFFEDFLYKNQNDKIEIQSSILFEKFMDFCKTRNFKDNMNIRTFSMKIIDLDIGIDKSKSNYTIYNINKNYALRKLSEYGYITGFNIEDDDSIDYEDKVEDDYFEI